METSLMNVHILILLFSISQAANIGYFWHVTDMHWDPTYSSTYRGVSCGDGTPGGEGGEYGKYGDYLCDSPWTLINSSIEAMREIKPEVDFLIWTGDDTPHNADLTLEAVGDIISNLTTALLTAFPDTPVYPVLGNHDWSPKHHLPPNPPGNTFYSTIAGMWEPWLGPADTPQSKMFSESGFYSVNITDGLLFVGLNTNLYYRNNVLTSQLTDPSGQLDWLDRTLTSASMTGQKVMLVGHVPPGQFEKHRNTTWFMSQYNSKFTQLLRKHSHVLASSHFAHHHTDSFRVIYDTPTGTTPLTSFFIAPAVTPWETTLQGMMGGAGNNPGIRLLEYDRNTGHVTDIHQYYLNLTAANRIEAKWVKAYQATTYFGIQDVSANSLNDLAQKMWNDDEVFDKYYSINGLYFPEPDQWDHEFKVVHYCAITRLDTSEYERCLLERSFAQKITITSLLIVASQFLVYFHLH